MPDCDEGNHLVSIRALDTSFILPGGTNMSSPSSTARLGPDRVFHYLNPGLNKQEAVSVAIAVNLFAQPRIQLPRVEISPLDACPDYRFRFLGSPNID